MHATAIRARIKLAWWLRHLYLPGVGIVAKVTGTEPDWEKVTRMVERGTTVEVVRGRA